MRQHFSSDLEFFSLTPGLSRRRRKFFGVEREEGLIDLEVFHVKGLVHRVRFVHRLSLRYRRITRWRNQESREDLESTLKMRLIEWRPIGLKLRMKQIRTRSHTTLDVLRLSGSLPGDVRIPGESSYSPFLSQHIF